jgi:putative phosphoribosyl transferase
MKSAASRYRFDQDVTVPVGRAVLAGHLTVTEGAEGIVVFAHGSGSGRFSPRNQYVAGALQEAGLATLLMDLLTQAEEVEDERTARLRFDIALLGGRVVAAIDWAAANPVTRELRIGLFGASTGAAAALLAASERPAEVVAVVSRGGRPDLAGRALALVQAPTLLIVGGDDVPVIGLNQTALARLPGEKRLAIVPGATHLFEEPGTLEQVAQLAADWFAHHLRRTLLPAAR